MNRQKASTFRTRSISASEIARSKRHFETWSTHQGCELVAFSDLPAELKEDVISVFNVGAKLPANWGDKTSKSYKRLAPPFRKFMRSAYAQTPELFSDKIPEELDGYLAIELANVFLAWRQLKTIRASGEKLSEADFAVRVYNILRSPAIRESTERTQCSISLPQYLPHIAPNLRALRILSTRSIVPDGALFIPASSVRHLSKAKSSPYKLVKSHPQTQKACGPVTDDSAFHRQTTPCVQPPTNPCFEFASVFWEDKKPGGCEALEHAFRQNRMACAAALRHLHSLHIQAPVYGLIWAGGKVKAHVDWCAREGSNLAVYSAPYPGPDAHNNHEPGAGAESDFHEWDLEKPADILSVYLLIRNLDQWTAGDFRERVEEGVQKLVEAITEDGVQYVPWKRDDMISVKCLVKTSSLSEVENTPPTSCVSSAVTSAEPGPKSKCFRGKATDQGQTQKHGRRYRVN